MAGYIRQDVTNNIADGNVINASDFDNEYNAIEAAFHAATGHTHDGTAAEGAPITKIGPTQDVVASASALTPKTDNTVDLGSASFEFKDLYIDGTANIDSLVADTADINGGTIDGTTIGGASAAAGTFTTATATTGNITTVNATTVDTTNIEVTSLKAKDGTSAGSIADSTGVVTLASSILTTTDINGGSIDGTAIGAASASTGAFTTLAASGAVTLSGGTANGVLYLNGSKVVTSGSALTFDGTRLTSIAGKFGGGAASNSASLMVNNVTNTATGIQLFQEGVESWIMGMPANSAALTWAASGSEQMRLTSTGLGIGTSSPQSRLEARQDQAGAITRVIVNNNNATAGSGSSFDYYFGTTRLGGLTHAFSGSAYLGFDVWNGSAATERMRLDSSGNLGIGTSSPAAKLEIAQSADTTDGPKLRIANNGNTLSNGQLIGGIDFFDGDDSGEGVGAYIYSYTTDSIGRSGGQDLRFATGATETMRLDSSGNLGLGVTPSASSGGGNFNLSGDILGGSAVTLGTNWYFNGGFKYKATGTASRFYLDSTGGYAWYTAASGTAGDPISFSQVMTLDASGNLGIGTTSPGSKLNVVGTTAGIGYLAGIVLSDNATTTVSLGLQTPGGSDLPFVYGNSGLGFGTNSAERLRIDSSGNLGLGVTPSAWALPAFESQYGLWAGRLEGNVTSNAYFNGGYNYIASGIEATRYRQLTGTHTWFTAASGTAGDPISFTQAMTLDVSGNLLVGTTSALLNVAGRGNITLNGSSDAVIAFGNGGAYSGYVYSSSDRLEFDAAGVRFIQFNTNNTERARITSGGNFKIGGTADRATTEGDKQLVLFDGTAPVGTLANGVSFYSASGEANVMDAAGNATLLSPHDAETNEWIFRSKHTPTGKVLKIDVERLLKFVNDHFGLDAVHEFIEA